MKKLLLIILIISLLGNLFLIVSLKPGFIGNVVFGLEKFEPANLETGFVTKVIDGDTVVVGGESIRLLGIDTNERGEKCYKEAKIRLEELVLNKEIKLERDVKDKDQYKRLLRYVFVEENEEGLINVNLILVGEGLAIARFYEDKKYKKEILETETKARENKIGCKWS
ncbi:MAG: thermonuclease family protein [Nanoarchaeota archaeon]